MTAPARFRLVRKYLLPSQFTTGEGELLGYALDIMKDAFVQRVYLGLLARFPETAPADALAAIGRNRRVVRGIAESRESYVHRLIRWIDDRQVAGNPYALMQKLAEYTGPGCRFTTVDASGNWFLRNLDGSWSTYLKQANWDWDSINDPTPNRWSRFWVIIHPPAELWTDDIGTWGDDPDAPSWGETADITWGSTAPREHVETIRSIVSDWKPGGTRCVNIIVAFDPTSFHPFGPQPDGNWGRWSKNVGGVQVPARLDTARYWAGV